MPTLAVPRAVEPARLLALHSSLRRPVVLDGSGHDSWDDGRALLAADPRATLAIHADGRADVVIYDATGRAASTTAAVACERVRWAPGEPLALWQRFLDEMPNLLGTRGDHDAAGFVTMFSYDLKHWIEKLPRRLPWPGYPLLYCAFYDWTYRYDHRNWSGALHTQSDAHGEHIMRSVLCEATVPPARATGWERLRPHMGWPRYHERFATIQRYIAAGDVYQVNFAQPFVTAAALPDAPTLFARWQHAYPMPFAAYVDAGDVIAVCNSPECFLNVNGDRISTFPIKGTTAIDGNATRDLRNDAKEWAEHVMIVDLERNDLGRICRNGTVEVVDFGTVRRFPLLAHMVSEVRGRVRPGVTLPEIVRATFPGGSITGAPKIRAMQIIEELEIAPRGLYTGAIGWTDLHGASRFNLAIRTAIFANGTMTYSAGGGIVADSDAAREYEETLLKSEAIFRVVAAL